MNLRQRAVKRLFDIVASLVGSIVLLPFALVAVVLLKLSSRGPVLYVQQRVGRYGTLFTCMKLRTMTIGADQTGTVTTANDKRVTRIGRLLRKFKIDEFPQLYNVFIGKMSFVGPRPDVPGYADRLAGNDRKILELRPGITGPATIFFRHEELLLAGAERPEDYNDTVLWPIKVRMNLRYLDNWSFTRDLGYILTTVLPFTAKWINLVPSSPRTCDELEFCRSGID